VTVPVGTLARAGLAEHADRSGVRAGVSEPA
jgi:hypothetical protein